jgi:DNA-directed RNA polymerase specialized sigma24 family protein
MDWEQVVSTHGPMVWGTAYRMLGHYQDASDCYQETFVQALRVANREPVRDWGSLLRRQGVHGCTARIVPKNELVGNVVVTIP